MGTRAPCPPSCGLSYFYLGKGWVITARHVGAKNFRSESDGRVYSVDPASARTIVGERGVKIDLMLFRILDAPNLPLYPIVEAPPPTGSEVVMMGRGRSRGKRLPGSPSSGWDTASPAILRWGTNRVDSRGLEKGTRVLALRFDRPGAVFATEHEAHATAGDSGGPVFVKSGERWQLAGIMINASKPLYEGYTGVVDLAYYRDQILEIVAP